MFNSKLLSSITVAVVAALMLCTVVATVSPSVRAANGWNGGAITGTYGSAVKHSPSLAYTSTGDPRVAYYDWTNGDLWFWARTGGTWYYKLVDSTGNVGEDCALTLKNNLPWISYFDATHGDLKCAWEQLVCSPTVCKVIWHIEKVDTVGDVGLYTSICISPLDGQPRISYFDDTNANLKYAYRTASGSWVTTTVDSAGDVGRHTSIAINPVTKLVGISYGYHDAKHNYLKCAWKDSSTTTTFKTTIADSSVTPIGTSLAFNATGNPCIAYTDWTNSDLKYTKLWKGTWYYKTFPTAAVDGCEPSLVLSNNGLPRISSIDKTNQLVMFTWEDAKWGWHKEGVNTATAGIRNYETSIAIYRATGKTGISYIVQTPSWGTYSVLLFEKTAAWN